MEAQRPGGKTAGEVLISRSKKTYYFMMVVANNTTAFAVGTLLMAAVMADPAKLHAYVSSVGQ
jgi:hypothetical protein